MTAAPPGSAPDPIVTSFREHERHLWGLCYRLTGSAAEADDLVQETFVRAIQSPPPRADQPWRPWLVKVALNLGRDALRKRRRRGYVGPWLPSPIETEDDAVPSVETGGEAGTEARYDLLESVSFAFLVALEALTPKQRAVLLLRDVFDYSVEETAEAIGLSEANVKTTHHRARRALAPYEESRSRPAPKAQAEEALRRFLAALATGDAAAVEAILAEDVRATADGGGVFHATRKPLVGRAKVAHAYLVLTRHTPPGTRGEIRTFNGLPALSLEQPGASGRFAPRLVVMCSVDASGRIRAIYGVLAQEKLTRVPPVGAPAGQA